jgi:hypothetical protein
MSNTKRITIWVFLLIGSAFLFYLWANQRIYEIRTQNDADIYIDIPKTILKKSTDDYYKYSTSTPFQILLEKDLDMNIWSTTTLKIATSSLDDKDFNFIYPDKTTTLYSGCTYEIKLDLHDKISPNYIGIQLIDSGSGKSVSNKDSGLINSISFKNNIFRWTVGDIWPGQYYLFIPLIDGVDVKIKSQKFKIEKDLNNSNC